MLRAQANKWALRALKALNLKPISPATPDAPMVTPVQSTPEARSPFFFSPWAFPPINLAKVGPPMHLSLHEVAGRWMCYSMVQALKASALYDKASMGHSGDLLTLGAPSSQRAISHPLLLLHPLALQVRKGRFVVLTEGLAGADSAFCMGGEQLWLGRVDHRGPNTVKLLMYKPQRNAAGKHISPALTSVHLLCHKLILISGLHTYLSCTLGIPLASHDVTLNEPGWLSPNIIGPHQEHCSACGSQSIALSSP